MTAVSPYDLNAARIISPRERLQLAGWLVVLPENLPPVDLSAFSWPIPADSLAEIVCEDGYLCVPPQMAGDVAEIISAGAHESVSASRLTRYERLRVSASVVSLLIVLILLIVSVIR